MKFFLGDLFTLSTHPFLAAKDANHVDNSKKDMKLKTINVDEQVDETHNFENVLVGADSSFIPPILVVCDLLIEKETQECKQIKGVFYSHKTGKFEKRWFKPSEIKKIDNSCFDYYEINLDHALSFEQLKDTVINKVVILKSVKVESEKEKISQERRNFESLQFKKSPLLSYVPPVMMIADVRNSEKDKPKKIASKLEFKCRFFNPINASYSEEWLIPEILGDITKNFAIKDIVDFKDKLILTKLKFPVSFEDSAIQQINTIVAIKELVFNHYNYIFKCEDLWSRKISNLDIHNAIFDKEPLDLGSIFYTRIPNAKIKYPLLGEQFDIGSLYEIDYFSDRGILTNRIIYVVDKYKTKITDSMGNTDTLVIANCLLRNGRLRHFKVSNIKSARKVKEEFQTLFIKGNSYKPT